MTDDDARDVTQADTGGAPESPKPKRRRGRGVVSVALLLIGAFLLPLAVITVWTRNQILNTDRYVDTMAPLASDPVILDALANRVTKKLSDTIDIKERAEAALPPRAQFLATPIATAADNFIDDAATKLLNSDQFKTVWREANRRGHDDMVAVLTGRHTDAVTTNDGKVVVSIGPIAAKVLNRIENQFGLDISSKLNPERLNIKFVLVDSDQLAKVQAQIKWLDRLAWMTVLLAVVCLVGSVFALPDRRKGLLRVGFGVAIAMLLMRIGISTGRELYLSNLPSTVQRPDAAANVFDTLVRFVLQAVRAIFAVGVVIVIGAWVSGPSKAAMRIRTGWNRLLSRGGSGEEAVEPGAISAWVAAHLTGLRVFVGAAAALALVTWTRPTGKVVLLIAFLAVVALAIVQAIAGTAGSRAGNDSGAAENSPVSDPV